MSKLQKQAIKSDLIRIGIQSKVRNSKEILNFQALVDCGANCSIITKNVIDALGITDEIKYIKRKAKGISGKMTTFDSGVKVGFNIGKHAYTHTFLYLGQDLPTRTGALIGNDLLNETAVNIQFGPDGPEIHIKNDKIPVLEHTKVRREGRSVATYAVRTATEDSDDALPTVKAADYKKIYPWTAAITKVILPPCPQGKWDTYATLEKTSHDQGYVVEEQMITIRQHKPKLNAKCKETCTKVSCVRDCPTVFYYYAFALVFNVSNRVIYLKPGENIADIEAQHFNEDLTEKYNYHLNQVIKREKVIQATKASLAKRKQEKQQESNESNPTTRADQNLSRPKSKIPIFNQQNNKSNLTTMANQNLSKSKSKIPVLSRQNSNFSNEETSKPTDIANKALGNKVNNLTPTNSRHSKVNNLTPTTDIHKEVNNLAPDTNFLHLDPIKDKQEYLKEYHKKHKPPITIEHRRQLVKDLLDAEEGMDPLAKDLLLKYPEVVHLEGIPFVGTDIVKHHIDYRGATFFNKQYRVPKILEADIKREISRLISEGIIEPSESEYNNAMLPVAKRDPITGKLKLRLVIDLRTLNKSILVDRLAIADIQELLNQLEGYAWVTHLDCASGYLQISLTADSQKYTAFRYNNNCYTYRKLCFGLGSAPSTYIRAMNLILSGISNIYIYMDDIIIFNRTKKEHLQTLDLVLKRFSYHGMELSLKKSYFLKEEVEFLGFRVTKSGLKPTEKLLKPMLDIKLPKTLTEARRLCSLFSFYRRFIRNFAAIVEPLVALTRGHGIKKGERALVEP